VIITRLHIGNDAIVINMYVLWLHNIPTFCELEYLYQYTICSSYRKNTENWRVHQNYFLFIMWVHNMCITNELTVCVCSLWGHNANTKQTRLRSWSPFSLKLWICVTLPMFTAHFTTPAPHICHHYSIPYTSASLCLSESSHSTWCQ
jgi:hypothetical protein